MTRVVCVCIHTLSVFREEVFQSSPRPEQKQLFGGSPPATCLSFLSKRPRTSVALMETPAAENPGSQEFYHMIEPVNCLPPSSGKWELKAARDPFFLSCCLHLLCLSLAAHNYRPPVFISALARQLFQTREEHLIGFSLLPPGGE